MGGPVTTSVTARPVVTLSEWLRNHNAGLKKGQPKIAYSTAQKYASTQRLPAYRSGGVWLVRRDMVFPPIGTTQKVAPLSDPEFIGLNEWAEKLDVAHTTAVGWIAKGIIGELDVYPSGSVFLVRAALERPVVPVGAAAHGRAHHATAVRARPGRLSLP